MAAHEDTHRNLRVGFRGYDRVSTDALLAQLDARNAALSFERTELRRQLDQLVSEVEQHRDRSHAVASALVTAQQAADILRLATEAELAGERQRAVFERDRIVDEGLAVQAEARREATEIVREARIRADRLVDQVVGAVDEYQRETDHFLAGARERLAALVQELLSRIPGSAPTYVVPELELEVQLDEPGADAAVA